MAIMHHMNRYATGLMIVYPVRMRKAVVYVKEKNSSVKIHNAFLFPENVIVKSIAQMVLMSKIAVRKDGRDFFYFFSYEKLKSLL